MIKHLILHNLVLVDTCEIHFGTAFNAITGETGAGKTALLEAIGLALGERADSSLIRKGCDQAFVDVCFDISSSISVQEMLEEAGLSADDPHTLVIRREISKEGKNRAFINCRMTPLPLLQKVGDALIDRISQHAPQALRSSESQRALLDLFGSLQGELKAFQADFLRQQEIQKKLQALHELATRRERDEDTWCFQLDEIQSVALKEGEEEEAFERYQKLAHASELSEKIQAVITGLSESPTSVLSQVSKFLKSLESLTAYDKTLSEPSTLLHEAHVALSEALRTLQSCAEHSDLDPKAFEYLEQRLSAITRLKRKYGQNFQEIEAYRQKIQSELTRLENSSEELRALENELQSACAQTDASAKKLSEKRKATAKHLSQLLTSELQELNMSGAEVSIQVELQARSTNGDDAVHFWLKANAGEHAGLVKEHSSGGELSRLLLAIKIALAEKNNTPTLLFDEIDANVGGKTATLIGEKLQQLGSCRQVICITHFPQVASKADIHFSVQKSEEEGRTVTRIAPLSKKQRQQELLRMIGGKELSV